jgi:MFS family permease
MQSAALAWLVYSLTGSALLLGVLGTFQMVPLIVLTLPAGVYVDRWPKRKVLLVTQSVFLLQALTLSSLVFTGRITYPLVLLFASVYGAAQAVDNPCRRAFIVDLVGKDDLMNAISLNSTVFGVARIIGPTLAALAMASLGGGWCFLLNAVSYLAVIGGLFAMSTDGSPRGLPGRRRVGVELTEGLQYVFKIEALRLVIGFVLVMGVFGLNYNVIAPVFADRVLGSGVGGYGAMLSAMGVGALIAAVAGASSGAKAATRSAVVTSIIASAIIQLIIPVFRSLLAVTVLAALLGFSDTWYSNSAAASAQTAADPAFRGRVMSVYTLFDQGTMPLGNAFAGAVMDRSGAAYGFPVCGAATILSLGALLLFNKKGREGLTNA